MRKILLGAGILTVVGLVGYTSSTATIQKNAQLKAQAYKSPVEVESTTTSEVQE